MSEYEAGENSAMADWDIALDGLLPDGVEPMPTQVATYIRHLQDENARLRTNAETAPAPDTETVRPSDAELHARCAHPDYEYRTTEGPRKQWDDVNVPPADEDGDPDGSWERNVDAGRDGWERWDYTEESYWRRRKQPR
ncbi:hypothetical protein [Streptomyces longwoodensis]|uniref:hypothetical protein n=1 Tax=Streptomyces longwoodensis TaxID=68231 RepID=UPI00225B631F|nr:hypothetical protein [Streptomyces longwoodensis]MCX5000962.1 hypothetical protein [Streptomyces longwoodensis]